MVSNGPAWVAVGWWVVVCGTKLVVIVEIPSPEVALLVTGGGGVLSNIGMERMGLV